jgi:hypothetical protein
MAAAGSRRTGFAAKSQWPIAVEIAENLRNYRSDRLLSVTARLSLPQGIEAGIEGWYRANESRTMR